MENKMTLLDIVKENKDEIINISMTRNIGQAFDYNNLICIRDVNSIYIKDGNNKEFIKIENGEIFTGSFC